MLILRKPVVVDRVGLPVHHVVECGLNLTIYFLNVVNDI